jgi:hypothetical protein
MTQQEAKRMADIFGRSVQFFLDMNVSPVGCCRSTTAQREIVAREQKHTSAISGKPLPTKEEIKSGKAKSWCLDHWTFTCADAAAEVWSAGTSKAYESVARRLWERKNLRVITHEEHQAETKMAELKTA